MDSGWSYIHRSPTNMIRNDFVGQPLIIASSFKKYNLVNEVSFYKKFEKFVVFLFYRYSLCSVYLAGTNKQLTKLLARAGRHEFEKFKSFVLGHIRIVNFSCNLN